MQTVALFAVRKCVGRAEVNLLIVIEIRFFANVLLSKAVLHPADRSTVPVPSFGMRDQTGRSVLLR